MKHTDAAGFATAQRGQSMCDWGNVPDAVASGPALDQQHPCRSPGLGQKLGCKHFHCHCFVSSHMESRPSATVDRSKAEVRSEICLHSTPKPAC